MSQSGAQAQSNQRLIERWKQVARVLGDLTPHEKRQHFDMATFGYKTVCGTVACALGHCGLDPWFRRRGFRMDMLDEPPYGVISDDLIGRGLEPLHPLTKRCKTLQWSTSPYEFFGNAGTREIFYNPSRRSVGAVIREVKAHIKALQSSTQGSANG